MSRSRTRKTQRLQVYVVQLPFDCTGDTVLDYLPRDVREDRSILQLLLCPRGSLLIDIHYFIVGCMWWA